MSIDLDTDKDLPVERPRRRRRWWAAAAAAAVLAATLGSYALSHRGSAAARGPLPTGAVTSAVMEERYGVRIDLVGLAALGGLMELRFTVLDKDKATGLFHDQSMEPEIVVEKNGTVLHPPSGMAHKLVLLNGASYFMLFTNVNDAVHEGDLVSIAVQQVRLEHVPVQS